ncbi:PilZ domain-containing protein [Thiocystis violacea]|uniref:PilZ domain-containing protein n=1 Tax=Thiocystis violacea TaxID=13725 RepID=UPI0019055DDC|nr:PilZ domain-containing protein [Thiocystis violacea]MBK1718395.1 pilus assembly protein PilZ [Thiocystis violacea]
MISETTEDERRCSERRSWECHARLFPLSLEPRAPMPSIQAVIARDISEGGLQVRSDRLFAIRSRLLVEMEAVEVPEGIQAVGSVAWISPAPSNNQWCLGIEFSDIGDMALTSIRNILRRDPDSD